MKVEATRLRHLHQQLDKVERAARSDYGETAMMSLLLSLLTTMRALVFEVEAVRREIKP
jgi:hypothetical protein